jgi:hypothetical protein
MTEREERIARMLIAVGISLSLPSVLLTEFLPDIGFDLILPGFVILSLDILLFIGGLLCVPTLFYVGIKLTT